MSPRPGATPPEKLTWENVECVPVIHGRLAFALEVRRRLLSQRYAAVALELPEFVAGPFQRAVEALPVISAILYRQEPLFLESESPWFTLSVQPADAVSEAVRIALRERVALHWVDAEIEGYEASPIQLPDPYALLSLGIQSYYDAVRPYAGFRLVADPKLDEVRERHMAARLAELSKRSEGPVLFICGLAHWAGIRQYLEAGTGEFAEEAIEVPEEQLQLVHPGPRSLPLLMGELPYTVALYERNRAALFAEAFHFPKTLTQLLLRARDLLRERDPGSLEIPEVGRLRTLLSYVRKLTVRSGRLMPDSYTLAVASKGVVGNDFGLAVLEVAHDYPYQRGERDDPTSLAEEFDLPSSGDPDRVESVEFGGSGGCESTESSSPTREREEAELDPPEVTEFGPDHYDDGHGARRLVQRVGTTAFQVGNLTFERRPDSQQRRIYTQSWSDYYQCSWPPEDLIIENFRDYVGKRALSLARVGTTRVEPFETSLLDGIDIRATMRDVLERRIFVREEPRIPGAVGALVIIFEEDDFGEKFPWRTTWMAEHQNESTLAFYATDFKQDILGPGVARAHYGGCLLIFPPKPIPDLWEDLRFERARTPAERLLLAAIYWAEDHYVVYLAKKPPRPELRTEANRRGKHILYLPVSTFSLSTLERLRRFHVLNGQHIRSYAHKFIR